LRGLTKESQEVQLQYLDDALGLGDTGGETYLGTGEEIEPHNLGIGEVYRSHSLRASTRLKLILQKVIDA